jgi:hypothetical protein
LATRSRGCYFQLIASRSKDENCLLECRQCSLMLQKGGRPLSCLLSPVMVSACTDDTGSSCRWREAAGAARCTAEFIIYYYYFRWPRAGVALTGRLSRAPLRCCTERMLLPRRAHSHCTFSPHRPGPGPGTGVSPHRVSLALRGVAVPSWLAPCVSLRQRTTSQPVDVTSRVFYLRRCRRLQVAVLGAAGACEFRMPESSLRDSDCLSKRTGKISLRKKKKTGF